MVDTALDELRVGDVEARSPGPRLRAFSAHYDELADVKSPPEFCVRAFWQVQELVDCVRECRKMLQAGRLGDPGIGCHDNAERSDRIASLLDKLDVLDEETPRGRSDLYGELRREIQSLLIVADREGSEDRIEAAIFALSEAEGRLTKLGHLFDGGTLNF
jgi:hypothetical protein